MISDSVVIFTDGSSRGNPGPGGYAAVIVSGNDVLNSSNVENNDAFVAEIGGREELTTNNRMELQAVISAFSFLVQKFQGKNFNVTVYSDSAYVINGVTKWVFGWRRNGWLTAEKNSVENRDLWEKLFSLVQTFKVSWSKVEGHIGVSGNERCDEIATVFADGNFPELYNGILRNYPVKNILDISSDSFSENRKKNSSRRSNQKAFSYVSRVDGVIQTHKTWAECEARVKGKSGALYKKSISSSDEKEIIASWQK